MRTAWASQSDSELLTQCSVDTYRASGPGGQKRNKTSSAVRLRHQPSGLIVIAEESRSQHENKAKALKRMRRTLWLEIREPVGSLQAVDDIRTMERIGCSAKNEKFWPAAATVLDVLYANHAGARDAATALGVSTANLTDFLRSDPALLRAANQIRTQFGRSPLR